MSIARRQHGRIQRGWLAGIAILALAGCQSMPMAFRHSRERSRPEESFAADLNETARSASGKRTRWALWGRKKADPASTIETYAARPTNSGQLPSVLSPATAERRPARVRLGAPIGSRSDSSASLGPRKVAPATASSTKVATRIPSLPARVDAEGSESSHWGSERLNEILLASAIAGSEGPPSDLNVTVAEEPIGMASEGSYLDASATEGGSPMGEAPVTVEDGSPMIEGDMSGDGMLLDPLACGVGPDGRGLWDNFSSRIGATYYDTALGHGWGALSTLESTWQLCQSNWFLHAAIAGEATNSVYPMSYSAGISRLAKVVGCQVEKPWIFSVAYDGYWVNDFFQTGQALYADQLRGMVGYAVKPCWDIGVWGAGGISTDRINLPQLGPGPIAYRASAGDRVAGYSAWNLCQTGIFTILSAGWENGPGGFFIESDGYIPLTAGCNFFIGGGYSDGYGGSTDLQLGLEFIWGRTWLARCLARKHGVNPPTVGKMYADMLPKHSACKVGIDPCCVRYRGGWANDTYRSAFRILPPSRFARLMDFDRIPTPPANNPTAPIPGGTGDPVTPPNEDCPPSSNPLEQVEPRISGRPQRESRLSQWLEQQPRTGHGSTSI